MHTRAIAVSLLSFLLAACGDDGAGSVVDARPGGDADPSGPDAGADPDEPLALAGITALHNQVRASVGVAPLVWDPALAQVAQGWADQCIDEQPPAGLIDHNPGHNPGRADSYGGSVGENIYGTSQGATPGDAVAQWASEEEWYDYASNTCAAGRTCGHYTQIVWSDTTKLGCGISNCPALTFGSAIVCDYAPAGNLIGQRPY